MDVVLEHKVSRRLGSTTIPISPAIIYFSNMADCTYFLDALIGTFLNSWQHFLVGYESEYVVPSDRNFDCDIKLMCYLKNLIIQETNITVK